MKRDATEEGGGTEISTRKRKGKLRAKATKGNRKITENGAKYGLWVK